MNISQITLLIKRLKQCGVSFAEGLSDDELVKIQREFQVTFPPDLKQLLQMALPVSDRFVNWRAGLHSPAEKQQVEQRINWPLEGMLFDVENNSYWEQSWGERPASAEERKVIVSQYFYTYPKLIPIYSHRYIPATPDETGNPVFSVYQMDIIYYGYDLASYFAHEFSFSLPEHFDAPEEPKYIEFWGDF
ncbi:SMI1/KNR4 family protein [Budviciaceae bacterium BWR-B9]|uniref:SMI1/KNR4 family protein n=1 Tax=Limnobaculum allomyrinae TaxID=2791986 RepID=A0ABS1IS90_9GAMM|nr:MULTISPECIES: SMI1/KNR4 family protein [Limnobaculum]MBK5144633.1 SMI1/KNR4 family protein [Limnobaculum allomyrinae]MBV7692136.1 SMI1/KNR4 family protein [Limnobaculum sp. M2-1]